MSTEIGYTAIPNPERTSIIQVDFESSPLLNDAMHRFLLPKYENRAISFRSERSRVLPFSDSNNDGIRYHPSIAAKLRADERLLQPIFIQPLAIQSAEIGLSRLGDVQIALELDLTHEQRRCLGGYVLGEIAREDHFRALAHMSHLAIRDEKSVAVAAFRLQDSLGMHPRRGQTAQARAPSGLHLLYPRLTNPRVIDHLRGIG